MMKILDLYIGRSFARHFLLVLFIIGFLFSLFEFFSQLDDVGTGYYQLKEALSYVFLTLPGRILDLIPECILLGGIVTLGLLSDNNELLAMQASGISVHRICWSVMTAALFPMLVFGFLGEFVVPQMEQHARTRRLAALADADISFAKNGFWARKGAFFIHVRRIQPGGIPTNVDIFEWNPEGRLQEFTHARQAVIAEGRRWVLADIEQKTFSNQGVASRNLDSISLGELLSAEQMTIQELPPETLSFSDLYEYTKILRERGQNADQYKMVFWQKVTTPLSTVAMVLVSFTFVFGPIRGITAGHRIMKGSIVGVVLHFFNQSVGHLGLILTLNPVITTITPSVLVIGLSLWLLSQGPS
jgi:lipopolysaccharide export system permease protein